jgi:hypothetical protein
MISMVAAGAHSLGECHQCEGVRRGESITLPLLAVVAVDDGIYSSIFFVVLSRNEPPLLSEMHLIYWFISSSFPITDKLLATLNEESLTDLLTTRSITEHSSTFFFPYYTPQTNCRLSF